MSQQQSFVLTTQRWDFTNNNNNNNDFLIFIVRNPVVFVVRDDVNENAGENSLTAALFINRPQ